jgi:demethylspheroidene O-methyltransferase
LLRGEGGGRLAQYWPYATSERPAELPSDAVAPYTALMSASQPMIAQEVVNAYSFRRHRCLLDVGGGEGAFLRAAAARHPNLRMMLFDLPPVAARAASRLAADGLDGRVAIHSGNFARDALPAGADVVSLVRVLHDHDDGPALRLLGRVRAALPPGGRLVLAEPVADRAGRAGAAYFGFYLLAMGQGRVRTMAEIGALLKTSGFEKIDFKQTDMPLLTSAVEARSAIFM